MTLPPQSPPAPSATPQAEANRAPLRRFGRFELRALLGKCSRSMSWLVFDPRAGQELILMLPRVAPTNQGEIEQWQRQLRLASRLSHPNLAHVIDIGQQDQWPFVTYDRALGETLEERLRRQPNPLGTEMAHWICQALEGLAFAHEAGLSHRSLQLSSLLINEADQVHVAGVEVAPEPEADSGDGAGIGGVSSDRRRRQRDDAEADLVAIGVIMQRVLTGQNVLDEPDVQLVIARMFPTGKELVRLPWGMPQPVPEALRAIVNRSTDRQPRQRYHNARTLHRALDGWRSDASREGGGPAALLLERMSRYGHLPAMPGVATRVNRLARMEKQHTSEVSQLVLQDMALTLELLRNVNSASLRGMTASSGGPVLNMQRAIAMLGLDGVKRGASALREWPGPLNETHAQALMGLMERVQRAGEIAQALRPAGYDAEVIYLITLLQNLGRLLVQYHFPDDALQIRQLMQPQPATPEQPNPTVMTETGASYAVLGIDIATLGAAAAQHWGLPEEVLHMIRRAAPDAPIHTPDSDAETLRLTASLANDVVDALLLPTPKIVGALDQLAKRYGRALGLGLKELHEALTPSAAKSAEQKNAKN
ncbi:HDOD domain-containing protein [Roseateles toxinivorans]|uniref:Non-specific serine/threonine protein kinase n=1 Tax=Roseateles toxinivorans TaxID=270368 RepID=A0A4R6QTQ9_9BURK|nr:HDOD domain-containing protein [Roseateles toxinivorans]TDP74259.1 non-specific serine/threonine protein kinase [Roseateles toxinivorans]